MCSKTVLILYLFILETCQCYSIICVVFANTSHNTFVWCDSKGVVVMLVKFLMDSNEVWELKGLKSVFSMVVLHQSQTF